MKLWEDIGIPVAVVLGILTALWLLIAGIIFGVQLYNQHNAPLAFAQCAHVCGASGVHTATPDYKCECNETKRFEGSPSLDLNIKQQREGPR